MPERQGKDLGREGKEKNWKSPGLVLPESVKLKKKRRKLRVTRS